MLVDSLEKDSQKAIDWFRSNQMIANPDKFKAFTNEIFSNYRDNANIIGCHIFLCKFKIEVGPARLMNHFELGPAHLFSKSARPGPSKIFDSARPSPINQNANGWPFPQAIERTHAISTSRD